MLDHAQGRDERRNADVQSNVALAKDDTRQRKEGKAIVQRKRGWGMV